MGKKDKPNSISSRLGGKVDTETTIMSAPGNNGMEKFIPIINRLQDACTQTGLTMQLDLPQIAVVGCQSAGKSSVLENFVGRDFLPRGNGIVTRRPLVLQLTNSNKEYGQFLHRLDVCYEDFDEIRSEIEEETDRTTGTNKGISDKPINLRIYSPRVLNVTLVDLPGLTKVPVGDQPEDIEHQTRDIILSYIRKSNCLILAVSPANTDLANSDALKLAREVDPDGNRTIGVITKLDLMDEGTDARDILENRVFQLQRGYVGVVNRSQKDIEGKKDIQAALKSESEFFVKHPSYNHMAERSGTAHLQLVLNRELTEHISKSIPGLQEDLQKKMAHFEKEVNTYKEVHITNPIEMKNKLLAIAQQLASDFNSTIGAFGQEYVETDKLSSGAQINIIFHERLLKEIERVNFDGKKIRKEIDMAIRNIHGIRCGLYSPQMAFESFTKTQIEKFVGPVTLCLNLVYEELQKAVRTCTEKIVYPKLRSHVRKIIKGHIDGTEQKAKQNVLSILNMEMAYMNTHKLDFRVANADEVSPDQVLPSPPGAGDSTIKSGNDLKKESELNLHKEVEDMFEKMQIYIGHVKDNLQDMVPKACTLYIIKELMTFIKTDVLIELMTIPSDEHPNLFKMDGLDVHKYSAASKMLAACKEAFEAIHELFEETNAIGAPVGNKAE